MYVTAAKSVVQRYPFQDTNPCSNPYDSWKLSISEKFRNERRTMQLPSVIKRKRSTPAGPLPKRPMKNWTTSRPTGEDDISISKHKEWLQAEVKKSHNVNEEKINHLMRLTFADRGKMIQDNSRIGEVKKEFPALFQVDQIHAEFSLLMGENLEPKFIRTMKPIFEKVVEWPFSRKEDCNMAAKAREMCKDDLESDALLIAGSFLLPRLFLENPNDLFVEGGRQFSEAAPIPSTPVVVYSGDKFSTSDFTIMAENEEICQPASIYTGLFSLVATFYCFNLEYPPKAKRTLEFLQKVGLSLHDGKKLSPRVASVYSKLQQ
ncbi:Sterile alpha motif domain-containing protein 3 [Holothuria leucospilota]|uniref:Sterile alpha motif domain-containing protein 3 n=1 Tax=Holothuria leucospilota TaxID=206669 RepID=A0A9Q1CQF8_HOLLE|nr:Sterile alpha motif domain-containing protein 3 [Holothuria leucospilota]